MRRRDYLRASGLAATTALLAGCGGGGGNVETYDVAGGANTQTIEVEMTSSGGQIFDPHVVWIQQGGTVTFNNTVGSHTTTSYSADNDKPQRIPDDADGWDSGTLTSGTFDHTFDVEGVYDYYCIPHESMGMLGSVIVGNPDPDGQPALADPQDSLPGGAATELRALNKTVEEALTSGSSGARNNSNAD
ncbi:plastocyanin/azurin family copper-binding protein [Halocalculus aciditolerans]|nr:plastocyanin/azurin family copper-binding protein [Halocalculus aciditolerans]